MQLTGIDPLSLKPIQSMCVSILMQHKRLMLMLPRQEGKTELGVRITRSIMEAPITRSNLFLAKDKKAGKRATAEKFQRLFDSDKFSVNTEVVYHKQNRSCVCFMESVDKDPDRMRGGTYFWIHWSEVAFSKLEHGVKVIDVYNKVIAPTQRKTNGFVFIESTPNGKNGWYDLWSIYEELGFKRLCVPLSRMTEMGLVGQDEWDKLKASTRPDVFQQEYECEFISFTGSVYSEFIEKIHVTNRIPAPEPWQMVVVAIDWGYTHATCCLFAYIRDGYICIFDEIHQTGLLIEEIYNLIDAKVRAYAIQTLAGIADHEPRSIRELNERGIPCGPSQKVNVLGARLQIKELLFKKRILIHPRCKFLIRDLQSATWDAKKPDEIDYSACSWGHYDAEAALRYLIREYSGFQQTRPTELVAEDVLSRAAWRLEYMKKQGNEENRHGYEG